MVVLALMRYGMSLPSRLLQWSLWGFFLSADHSLAGFSCYDPRMRQGVRGVFVPLAAGVRHCVEGFGSAKIAWSPVDTFFCWFPYRFTDGPVYALMEAVLPSLEGDACRAFGEDMVFSARDVVWSAGLEGWSSSLADSVSHTHPSQRTDLEVLEIP